MSFEVGDQLLIPCVVEAVDLEILAVLAFLLQIVVYCLVIGAIPSYRFGKMPAVWRISSREWSFP